MEKANALEIDRLEENLVAQLRNGLKKEALSAGAMANIGRRSGYLTFEVSRSQRY